MRTGILTNINSSIILDDFINSLTIIGIHGEGVSTLDGSKLTAADALKTNTYADYQKQNEIKWKDYPQGYWSGYNSYLDAIADKNTQLYACSVTRQLSDGTGYVFADVKAQRNNFV